MSVQVTLLCRRHTAPNATFQTVILLLAHVRLKKLTSAVQIESAEGRRGLKGEELCNVMTMNVNDHIQYKKDGAAF